MGHTKITGITLRDLVESDRALELLASRQMEGKIGYRIGKAIRRAEPEIKQFRKGLQKKIEGTNAYTRVDGGIKLDQKHEDYEKNITKIDKHRNSVLGEKVSLGDDVGTISLTELLEALPRRNAGTAEDPKWELAYIEPTILADLMWLITE